MPGDLNETGFVEGKTALLDAIELMDLHVRLEPDPRNEPKSDDAGSDEIAKQENR